MTSSTRIRQHRTRTLMGSVQLAAVVGVAVAAGVAAYDYFSRQDYLVVKNVKVTGNQRVPTQEVLDYAQVPLGVALYRAHTDAVQAGVLMHPDVAAAQVRRVPPDMLVIEVVEHVPVAVAALGQGIYLLDAEGHPFRRAWPGEDLDLPVVLGIERSLFVQDAAQAQALLDEAVAAVVAWKTAGQDADRLVDVEVNRWFGVTLHVGGLPTEVALGRGNLATKLARLGALEAHLGPDAHSIRRVFLDNARHPERVALLFSDAQEAVASGRPMPRDGVRP